jgi:hypothetical protein
MFVPMLLPCDGCGQLVDSAHISRRLTRLAWTTRFRPLHIQTLLLSGIAPKQESDFLYSPNSTFHGEAAAILKAVHIETEGKPPETVLAEFQKLGLLLAHVLECPLDDGTPGEQAHSYIEAELPATIARIRRSLKPKRILLLSADLELFAAKFHDADLPCAVLPMPPGVFLTSPEPTDADLQAFRAALAISHAHAVEGLSAL